MKPTEKQLDALIDLIHENLTSYYCKYCKRHLQREKDADVFVHDDVWHPTPYSPEAGGEHKIH